MSTNTHIDDIILGTISNFKFVENVSKMWAKLWTKTGTNDIFWDYNFQFPENIGKMSTNTHIDDMILGTISNFKFVENVSKTMDENCDQWYTRILRLQFSISRKDW